jgi:hypothetical protein
VRKRAAFPDSERGKDEASDEHEGQMQTERRDELVADGKALSDIPALKPYWGKLTVRESDQEKQVCSVGDRPTKAKVRSLVAWIAGRRETEFPKPIDKAIFQDGEQVIGP